jgi:hypothetical protein
MPFIVPNQALLASQRPIVQSTPWVRPADWISITDAPNEVQFLVSSLGQGSYGIQTTFTKPSSQNLYINWGDGVIDTISTNSSVITYHNYTTGGTACSLGYNTWKIRVYTDAGATITYCRPVVGQKYGTTLYPSITSGLLEAYYGDGVNITVWAQFFKGNGTGGLGNSNMNFHNFQYCKLPSTMNGSISFQEAFLGCSKLAKVIMPTSCSGASSTSLMFGNCYSLQSVSPFPTNATAITDMSSTFSSCVSLTGVTLPPSLPVCTTMASAFLNCYNLSSIQMPSLPVCVTYTTMFQNCYNLLSMNITGFTATAAAGAITFTDMFNACYNMEQCLLPASLASGSEANNNVVLRMFSTCYNLKTITLPSNFNAASVQNMFQNCYSLVSANFPISMSLLTSMNGTFSNCWDLQSFTFPTTVGATMDLGGAFSSCYSLGSITIPSTYNLTNLGTTFATCISLKTCVLPNNAQNSITTFTPFGNCYNLQSVTMPTSLTGVTLVNGGFQNTYNLESVVFPSTMNSVTNAASLFSGSGVKSVTMPTSMAATTTLSQAFYQTYNLKTIVLPTLVAANCDFSNLCQFNPSIESVTFPTSTTTTTVSLTSTFSNCANLATINNLQYIGDSGTTATNYINATTFFGAGSSFTGTTDFYCKFSKLAINGVSTTQRNSITGIRLRNTATGQYGGVSPQIDVTYTSLDATALNQLFTDLPTVTAKTINITGAVGAAGCNRTIATGKGWTVTG